MRETVVKMSQAFFPTNDGHVGNIKKLTMQQLLEMIQRQENLLKKKAFLKTLSDKGEKITQHLQVLKQELDTRKQGSSSPSTNSSSQAVHTDVSGKQKSDAESQAAKNVDINAFAKTLEADFEKMQVTDGSVESESRTKHQYEIAEERAEQNSKEMKVPQRLNRMINITHVDDLPAELKKPDHDIALQKKSGKKITEDEESAAVPPKYRYDEVKVITLEESLNLQTSQKQKQEELQSQLAAEKLADRLNIKLETYNPEGVDMSYRSGKAAYGDIDSDDEDGDNVHAAGMPDILGSDTED